MIIMTTLISMSPVALAYIDPISGSIILQALIGAFFAVVLFFKFLWRHVKSAFCRVLSIDQGEQVSAPLNHEQQASEEK